MNVAVTSLDEDWWATEIGGFAELPDERLNRRFTEILALMARKSQDSIPQAMGSAAAAKATYRFLSNKRVTTDGLLEPIAALTASQCRGLPVILAVHDTTSMNYSTLTHTTGLGPIGSSDTAKGLYVHTSLALRPDGLGMGVLHQECWSRPPEKRDTDHQRLPIEEKESCKWFDGIAGTEMALERLPDGERPRVIHLMDREGDIHEVLEAIVDSRDGAVIRSTHDRKVDEPIPHAHQAVAASPLLGIAIIEVPAQHGRDKRTATVELRSIATTVVPTRKLPVHADREPFACSLVEAREVNPPPGIEPLHWLLWTTEPAATLAEALEILRLYKLRWRVEDFHLTLKSGCRIEELELEKAERLAKAILLYSVVAANIVRLRDQARLEPDAPCTEILSDDAWKALWIHIKKKRLTPGVKPPTIHQAVLWIGRLGGHLNRKRDGMPGVRTLWRGWRDLSILVTGYRLARESR